MPTGQHVLIGSIALPGSEITAYHSESNTAFVIGGSDEMYVVSLADPANPVLLETIQLAGNAQSVAINEDGLIAVAVDQLATVDGCTATYHADGLVQFFTLDGGSVVSAGEVTVGSLPDSLAFNEDGTVLVTANEGEPNQFYGTDDDSMDPEGSISVIEINAADPAASVVTTLGFEAWNDKIELLRNKGVRISGDDSADGIDGNLVSQDMEPEYVTISGDKAYVSLQENNAIAVVDLVTKQITDIFSAGLKDWGFGDLQVDTSDKDGGIDPGHRDFYGVRMPDGIDSYEYEGETFVVMANEGDGRVRPDYVNFEVGDEYDGKYLKMLETLPYGAELVDTVTDPLTGNDIYIIVSDEAEPDAHEVEEGDEYFLTMKYGWASDDEFYSDETRLYKLDDSYEKDDEIGRLKVVNTETAGDPVIAFGGRSISIMDSKGNIVYDSGDLIEQAAIAAGVYDDGRSDDKGTEPENVTLAEVDGHVYAYVTLERVNSVAVFDVSNPYDVEFLELIDVEGDTGFVSPEGVVTADGYLIVSNEVTTGLAIYALPDTPKVGEEIPDMVVAEDSTLFARVLSNTFTDSEEGDTLTYTATLADGSPLPDWLHFDASSHSVETMEAYFLNEDNSAKWATDSASAITAMVTGQKTDAGNLSWEYGDPEGGELTTIAETLKAEYGFAIGVASTVEFSHATPAGVVSHDVNRGNKWDIAHEILTETQPEVVIGAGFDSYFATAISDAAGNDQDLDDNGYNDEYDAFHNGTVSSYTENVEFVERTDGVDGGLALAEAAISVSLADGERLFGLFGAEGGHFDYYEVEDTPGTVTITRGEGGIDEDPTMAEMAHASLSVLNQDSDGFFVMFEQGDIDWNNHANDFENMVGGVYDLDLAVTEVENYVASGENGIDWSNTLVILTSDHSNDYMKIQEELGIGDLPAQVGMPYAFEYPDGEVTYSSTGHTNELVTVSARGAGATYFGELAGQIYADTNIIDNTQIYTAMMNAAENAGAEHIVLMIGDGMNISHEIAASRYLYGEDFGLSWNDWGTLEDGWTGYATTWDVTSYNNFADLNGVAEYDPATYDPVIGYDPEQGGETPYPVAMTFSGTPDNKDIGTIDILVTATDKDGETVSQSFELAVENPAPKLVASNPVDDAIRVDVNSNIVMTFSESIQLGEGDILLKASAGALVETFNITSEGVMIEGNVLTINPTNDFDNRTAYSLDIENNAIMDLGGHYYAGTTSYDFTTVGLTSLESVLERAYVAYFGRPADPDGFNWWLSTGDPDEVINNVYQEFFNSDECLSTCASELDPVTHEVLNAPEFLNSIYQNLFHRDIGEEGLYYWGSKLSQDLIPTDRLVIEVLNGARGSDLGAVNSKVDAALALTYKIEEMDPLGYCGEDAADIAQEWLSDIYDQSTLDAALADQALTAVAQEIIDVSLIGVAVV